MARKPPADSRPGTPAATKERRDPGRRRAFPIPMESDSEDVHWALSAGATMWGSGDDLEALKWLRRAATSAAERDADARALELFRTAADIASELGARGPTSSTESLPDRSPAPSSTRAEPILLVPSRAASQTPTGLGVMAARDAGPARASSSQGQAARGGLGSESTILPRLPPEPEVTEFPRRRVGRRGEEGDEDTFIRPETMLRRALMAIDPDYARRTAYSPLEEADRKRRGGSSGTSSRPSAWPPGRVPLSSDSTVAPSNSVPGGSFPGLHSDDPEELTERRASSTNLLSRSGSQGSMPGVLQGFRVAVLPIPEERDVRLVFLTPGAAPPPGVAVAMLVPESEEDAQRLSVIYAECDAKL